MAFLPSPSCQGVPAMPRLLLLIVGIAVVCFSDASAQTPSARPPPDSLNALIRRRIALDSIDVAKNVKFRAGLEPPLHTVDADESQMQVLKDPYEVKGQGQPAAVGWYRIRFTVPDRLGKFPMPKGGYTCGVESNVLGAWETYTYVNGTPAGLWSKDGMQMAANQPPTFWMSTAPMPIKPGDEITMAILAMPSPLGRGSPDGYALRHLRLRFAYSHTGGRAPFYSALVAARDKLKAAKADELPGLEEKLKSPLERLDTLYKAAETERLEELTKAMATAAKEISDALKK